MESENEISESLVLAILLTISGGFMDAYSYMCRGEVFANAQTGNILLLGVSLASGKFSIAGRYLLPIISFAIGIATVDIIRHKFSKKENFLWHKIVLLIEAVILLVVGFIPNNLFANSLISLACGAQVESFRKIKGNVFATTMCIGNLRSAVQSACDYFITKDTSVRKKMFLFFGIIMFFVLGAILGDFCVRLFAQKAIIVSSVIMFLCFILVSKCKVK